MKLDTRTARTLLIYALVRLAALITDRLGAAAVDPVIIEQLADAVVLPLALYYLREALKKRRGEAPQGQSEESVR